MRKSKTLILGIIAVALITGASIWAVTYWNKALTHTITITGDVVATSNFPTSILSDSPDYSTIVSRTVDTLISSTDGKQYARVIVQSSNLDTCTLTLSSVLPGSVTVTADVSVGVYRSGTGLQDTELLASNVLCDGTQPIQILKDGDPAWLYENSFAGVYRLLYVGFTFGGDGNLPVGDHEAIISLAIGN